MVQGKFVVLAETLDVTHFEAGGFGASDCAPDGGEKMIGKHIAIHERAAGALLDTRRAHDRVMEKLAAGTEQFERSDKIIVKAFFRNMLGRADTGDAIKGFGGAKLKKIFDFDAAFACQTRGANALARNFRLMRAEGESKSLNAIVCRGSCITNAPQPHPISSKRWPGLRRNLRQM